MLVRVLRGLGMFGVSRSGLRVTGLGLGAPGFGFEDLGGKAAGFR